MLQVLVIEIGRITCTLIQTIAIATQMVTKKLAVVITTKKRWRRTTLVLVTTITIIMKSTRLHLSKKAVTITIATITILKAVRIVMATVIAIIMEMHVVMAMKIMGTEKV